MVKSDAYSSRRTVKTICRYWPLFKYQQTVNFIALTPNMIIKACLATVSKMPSCTISELFQFQTVSTDLENIWFHRPTNRKTIFVNLCNNDKPTSRDLVITPLKFLIHNSQIHFPGIPRESVKNHIIAPNVWYNCQHVTNVYCISCHMNIR